MVAPNVKSKTKKEDRDLWATPNEIYNGALRYFIGKRLLSQDANYAVDVCANERNTKHAFFFDEEDDALTKPWAFSVSANKVIADGGSVDDATMAEYPTNLVAWCNPPYSRGKKEAFIAKAREESEYGLATIMLLPNDTSAKWFSEVVKHAKAVVFICNGRINFINNATGERGDGNNAGSILALFAPKETKAIARTLYVTRERLEKMGA